MVNEQNKCLSIECRTLIRLIFSLNYIKIQEKKDRKSLKLLKNHVAISSRT